jgi:hypothetical protein
MNTSPNVIPWFTPEEWAKTKAICEDPDTMFSSHDVWLDAAQKTAKHEETATVTVHRVYLVADKLAAYAGRHNRPLNSETRVAYAIDLYIGAAV